MLFAYVIGVVVDIIMNLDPIGAAAGRKILSEALLRSGNSRSRRDHPQPPLEPAVFGVFDEPMLLGV